MLLRQDGLNEDNKCKIEIQLTVHKQRNDIQSVFPSGVSPSLLWKYRDHLEVYLRILRVTCRNIWVIYRGGCRKPAI